MSVSRWSGIAAAAEPFAGDADSLEYVVNLDELRYGDRVERVHRAAYCAFAIEASFVAGHKYPGVRLCLREVSPCDDARFAMFSVNRGVEIVAAGRSELTSLERALRAAADEIKAFMVAEGATT